MRLVVDHGFFYRIDNSEYHLGFSGFIPNFHIMWSVGIIHSFSTPNIKLFICFFWVKFL